MNNYSSDEFNALVEEVRDLSNKTDQMADSIALIDASVDKTKYLTKLLDVNISYPAENDVLVYDKTGKWKNAQYDEIGLGQGEGGESNVYVIGIGDETPATNENVYSAARTIEDWVSSKNDDTIEGNLTFAEGKTLYADTIRSRFASEGSDTGSGFIYKIKNDGTSYLEIDALTVRKAASFNTLEIKKINSISGNMIISPASSNIIRVEETTQYYEDSFQSVWRCYFREELEENGELTQQIVTDFQPGDLARIQEFNVQEGVSDDVKNRFYWGKVLGVGKNYIDLSKTDVDPSTNTQPMADDVLVMYGHKGGTYQDLMRQNFISISTYADNAPAIQMYQGVDDYSTENKAIIEMAYYSDQEKQHAYMNVFGEMYIGTKDKTTSYVKYDPKANDGAGLLTVKATIIVKDPDNESDVTLIEGGYIRTNLINADTIITTDLLSKTISSGDDDLNINGNFIIKPNGDFVCNSGTINKGVTVNGNITGAQGTIGGFSFQDNQLKAGSGSNYMSLNKDQIKFVNGSSSVTITSGDYGLITISSDTINALQVEGSTKTMINTTGFILNNGIAYKGKTELPYLGSNDVYLKPQSVYILTQSNDIDRNRKYYFPTIAEWKEYIRVNVFELIGDYICIPIFFAMEIFSTNQDHDITVVLGDGTKSSRPIIRHGDGSTNDKIRLDGYSFAYYMLMIDTSEYVSNDQQVGWLREITWQE